MRLIFFLVALVISLNCLIDISSEKNKFKQINSNFEQAIIMESFILTENAEGIEQLLSQQGEIDSIELSNGESPLTFAIKNKKEKALLTLLKKRVNPNKSSNSGEMPVVLAVDVFYENPNILKLILEFGGDPNTKRNDGNPIITSFLNRFNHVGAALLANHGANVNEKNRNGDPLVIAYATTDDWDNVLFLLMAGANYLFPENSTIWRKMFSSPDVVSPASAAWLHKIESWNFLKRSGIDIPISIEELVGKSFFIYLEKNNFNKPTAVQLSITDDYYAYWVIVGKENPIEIYKMENLYWFPSDSDWNSIFKDVGK